VTTSALRALLTGIVLVGLAAAGAALALAGPRAQYGVPASPQAVAQNLLAEFAPPGGAVVMGADPAQLGVPSDAVPARGGVDLHRFFFVPGAPEPVINSISFGQVLPARLGVSGWGTHVVAASEIFDLDSAAGQARRLEIRVARLPGGGSALRVDAQAWPMPGAT